MIKSQRFRVVLVLGVTFVSAVYGRAQPTLTGMDALAELMKYQGPMQRLHATFPQAVSDGPALTSMGPASVSDECYAGWLATMTTLRRKGYLSSVRHTDHAIGFSTAQVTDKGKAFFDHVTSGSFYCTVQIVPDLETADVRVGAIRFSADGKRAQVEFRTLATEPFRIMWESELFAAGCGGEVDPAVFIDQESVVGHAHFRFRKAAWRIDSVLLGGHLAEE